MKADDFFWLLNNLSWECILGLLRDIISLTHSETRLNINFCQTIYFFIHSENKTEGTLNTSTSVSATENAGNVELLTIHDAVRIQESPSYNL